MIWEIDTDDVIIILVFIEETSDLINRMNNLV